MFWRVFEGERLYLGVDTNRNKSGTTPNQWLIPIYTILFIHHDGDNSLLPLCIQCIWSLSFQHTVFLWLSLPQLPSVESFGLTETDYGYSATGTRSAIVSLLTIVSFRIDKWYRIKDKGCCSRYAARNSSDMPIAWHWPGNACLALCTSLCSQIHLLHRHFILSLPDALVLYEFLIMWVTAAWNLGRTKSSTALIVNMRP